MKPASLLLPGNAPRLLLTMAAVSLLIAAHFLLFQSDTAQAQGDIIYVDADASGANDGTSWEDAYATLQDALAVAWDGDEIWIAAGVYYPDEGIYQTDNDRYSTFYIPPGVSLYGSFAGGEEKLEERDWEANPTVLSGDIDGNDTVDGRGVVIDSDDIKGGNALHVVTLDGTGAPVTASTRLDGVIITAGQADGSDFPDTAGGGLYCDGYGAGSVCSPTLTNVTFAGNLALFGGAMLNDGDQGTSSPTLTNVAFTGNQASTSGGAMYNVGYNGGQSSPTLTNVAFTGNRAEFAGAMFNDGYNGGVSSPVLTNVTFAGNSADEDGGAMVNFGREGESSPVLINVTFSGNRAAYGGAMLNEGGSGGQSSPKLTNVILWGNSAGTSGDVMYNLEAKPIVAHSLVEGGWDGTGIYNDAFSSVTNGGNNIDANPLFMTPINPADAPTTAGDLRLRPDSPAIDSGDNDALPPDLTTDLDGNPRIKRMVVDRGAYEFIGRFYVDAHASGDNDGSSWPDAFTKLQDALVRAKDGDEIWIAAGIYYPDEGMGQTADARDSRFNITPGVSVYGGFAGTETELEERDWEANPTVLSGDIDHESEPDEVDVNGVVIDADNIKGDNAYHVVWLDGTGTPINGDTRLDGVIITAGNANDTPVSFPDNVGGGLFCRGNGDGSVCSPTLTNITFSGNRANGAGGAMFNYGYDGGESSPTLTNVTFSGNAAGAFGGGMFNDGSEGASSPMLTNVSFAGNWAGYGGAMYNDGGSSESSPTLTNVTFSGNSANYGGAMYNYGGSATLANVTFSGNLATDNGGAMYNDVVSATLTNVILWDNSAGGEGDVMYNSGATTIAHSLVEGGLDGGGIYNDGGIVTNGGNNIDGDPLFVMPVNPDDAPTTAGDLRLRPGSPAIDAGDDSVLPPGLTTDLAGAPRVIGEAVDMGAYESMTRLYVDENATGENNGSSWDDAFTTLQDALSVAYVGSEIWVAKGVYTPGVSRSDSFNIPSGVAVYGGFAGGENELEERKWEDNPTVLSGDIGGDDGVDGRGVVTDTVNIKGGNAYHVVRLDGTTTPITASTRIDGVVITAGQADSGYYPDYLGGGLYCAGNGAGSVCSPTLTNVIFSGNWAEFGGAMVNYGEGGESSPTLTNVTFASNSAGWSGGAMLNAGVEGTSSPTLTNVTFTGNWAGKVGGAMLNDGSSSGKSSPTLTNVTFVGNQVEDSGGAMYNNGYYGQSNPTLTNVTFAGNRATVSGGAMVNNGEGGESSPTLTNVTFSGNWASDGGAMYNDGGNSGESSPMLTNVILWGNSAGHEGDVMYNDAATPTIAYSLVQGHSDDSSIVNSNGGSVAYGDGNIDADPLFVAPVNPADAPTTAGDLRLRPGSAAVNAGDNSALPAGVDTDLDGNPRVQGDVVDMGAYEYTPALLAVEMNPSSVLEDSGQALTVTFTRTQNTVGELVVAFDVGGTATFNDDYVQSGATSFDGSSGTVTLGDGVISHTLLLTPTADFIVEPDETITLSLTPSGFYELGTAATVTGTILNDDTAGVLVSPTAGLTTTEAGGTASFTVTLQSEPAGTVTVTLTGSDPTEGTISPEVLTFNAGNWQTAQTVTVTGVDDDEEDGDVTYTIELTVSSDDPTYDGLAAPSVTVTNLDDDVPVPVEYRAYLPLLFGSSPPPSTVEAGPARSAVALPPQR